jgi:hypothetical protein
VAVRAYKAILGLSEITVGILLAVPSFDPQATFARLSTEELREDPATAWPSSRAAGLARAFKRIESAQTRWRVVNAPHLVALVRAGAVFVNGNGKNPRSPTLRGMTIYRMDHAGVVVEDLVAAIAFFVELGLELEGSSRG